MVQHAMSSPGAQVKLLRAAEGAVFVQVPELSQQPGSGVLDEHGVPDVAI